MAGVGSHELAVLLAVALDAFRPCWWCRATGGSVVSDLAVRELRESDWDYWAAWLARQPWGPPCSLVSLMERNWQAMPARIPLC